MDQSNKTIGHRRRGAVAVEMAVVTPLLLLVLFGIIEFGWLFSVRQRVQHAADQGARWSVLPGNYADQDPGNARLLAEAILPSLDGLNVSHLSVTRDPATSANDANEVITVAIPLADVALPGFVLRMLYGDYGSKNVQFIVTMRNPKY